MAVHINADQFCGLATNATWQAWLYQQLPSFYQELAEHLRTSSGCGANREKMSKLMERILAIPDSKDRLVAFLSREFPYMLKDEPKPTVATKPPDLPAALDVPFAENVVGLYTFPRRRILYGPGSVHEQLQQLIRNSPEFDTIEIANRVYVEYLPPEAAQYCGKLPQQNWLIHQWRARERP